MKKHLTILAGALICVAACNTKPEGGLSTTAQKNLDAMRGVTKCFETKDFSKLGDFIAVDAVDHSGENGEIKGLDSMKAAFEKWMGEIDNMRSDPIKELADDDYVMSWYHYTGTYKTAGMGHKAGDQFNMKTLEVAKFKDGKATEHWALMEPGEVMKMMGGMQQPTGPKVDSTKKM